MSLKDSPVTLVTGSSIIMPQCVMSKRLLLANCKDIYPGTAVKKIHLRIRNQLGGIKISPAPANKDMTDALFAQPLGIVMAWLLTDVVNHEAFGWTLGFRVSPRILLEAMLMAVVAALVSTVWPSWRASRLSPSQALRSE